MEVTKEEEEELLPAPYPAAGCVCLKRRGLCPPCAAKGGGRGLGWGHCGSSAARGSDLLHLPHVLDEELAGWYFTSVRKVTCYFAK